MRAIACWQNLEGVGGDAIRTARAALGLDEETGEMKR